jgi:hypothetical protein
MLAEKMDFVLVGKMVVQMAHYMAVMRASKKELKSVD